MKIISKIIFKLIHRKSNLYIRYLKKKGVAVGKNCKMLDPSTCIIDLTRPSLVTIGDNVLINRDFTLLTHDYVSGVFINCGKDFLPSSGKVTIGNNVHFGYNVIILKGVTIGDNVFIGAGSIVTKDIPSNCVAAGNPCRVIKTLDEYFDKRKSECIDEAYVYARSIRERFNRMPVPADFWEEFPLFVSGDKIEDYPNIPIEYQLGPTYTSYRNNHKALFESFDEFLKKADVR